MVKVPLLPGSPSQIVDLKDVKVVFTRLNISVHSLDLYSFVGGVPQI